jgi:hypothetical protein
MGKNFFFRKFFVTLLTHKVFFFFKKHNFLFPFGFIKFLKKMYEFSFSLKQRDARNLVEIPTLEESLKKKKISCF